MMTQVRYKFLVSCILQALNLGGCVGEQAKKSVPQDVVRSGDRLFCSLSII